LTTLDNIMRIVFKSHTLCRLDAIGKAKISRQTVAILMLCCVAFSMSGCDMSRESAAPVSISGSTMGTSYSIKLSELPAGVIQEELHKNVDNMLERINDQMSNYRQDSELSRFNRFTGRDWFDVSPETAQVVREALSISLKSGGAFDVTVGPLVNLWSFGPQQRPRKVPSDEEINAMLAVIGYEYLKVRTTPPAIQKLVDGLEVDLSAIAKGFAVDQVAELLIQRGVKGFMVEIGGEIRTYGTKANGSPWTVGIELPADDQRRVQEVVKLDHRALATSGDYRNFFVEDGKRYSHTIDPRTGRPVEHRLASVSVISEHCMFADAWATTLMVLGPEKGYEFAVGQDLAVMFVTRDENGFSRKPTPAFNSIFAQKEVKH
jgi:thiamine biosynthesis lipoprotein